jgi:hypothetical protein
MSKLGTITLTGASGKKYEFAVYPRSDTFKAMGAVYVQSKREIENGKKVHTFIYVGQTGDLSDRPLNHHRKACFDREGANSILLHLESNKDARLKIETDIMNGYDMPCNRQ